MIKIKIFNKKKKTRKIMISQQCTKTYDQIMLSCRVMALTNTEVILGHILPFYPFLLESVKLQPSNNNHNESSHEYHNFTPVSHKMCFMVTELRLGMDGETDRWKR